MRRVRTILFLEARRPYSEGAVMLSVELFSAYGNSLATADVADLETAMGMATANDDCVAFTLTSPEGSEDYDYVNGENENWVKSEKVVEDAFLTLDPDFTIDEA